MGGDGGTIISRRDCLRFNKGRKENNLSKDMRRMTKWLNCSLSQEPLHKPISACRLGRLYNKDRLIEHLLNRHTQTAAAANSSSSTSTTEENSGVSSHVKSLKDVKDLSVCENVQRDHLGKNDVRKNKSNTTQSQPTFPFVCPIMGMEMNGVYRFAFPWTCGCLMAERAIRSLQVSVCPNCNKDFDPSDIVIVHAEGDDLELMRSRLDAKALELEETRRLKKANKKKQVQHSHSGVIPPTESNSTKVTVSASETGVLNCEGEEPEMKKMKKMTTELLNGDAADSGGTDSKFVDKEKEVSSVSVPQLQNVQKGSGVSLNSAEMKASQSFKSLFHKHNSTDKTLDPNRGFWSQTTHSYFFKGTS